MEVYKQIQKMYQILIKTEIPLLGYDKNINHFN